MFLFVGLIEYNKYIKTQPFANVHKLKAALQKSLINSKNENTHLPFAKMVMKKDLPANTLTAFQKIVQLSQIKNKPTKKHGFGFNLCPPSKFDIIQFRTRCNW